ncbi:tetratricopeptide repeat protein [Micromonospora sp. C95]|uniref:tetratricopeptide repeat protein n=1 Tax=Micromonospora sp. C95 TaxID=2824882 RepID=UPI001B35F3A4|nr:tetratricopeptide repeat protein [Micromonospora sp. C95]MBQ1026649.1 tetratricopeptide repeat protein [Micromonospora sp. C95]
MVVVICRIGAGRIVLTGVEDLLTRSRSAATVAQWAEVHRLAVAGREPVIARYVGARVARVWLRTSRFVDADALATATLTLGPDAGAFYHLGWAQFATGRARRALDSYERALHLYREADDRAGEAVTLTNIGSVYDGLGDWQQALTYYQQALPTLQEVGDRANEAATLTNIGAVYHALGDWQQALTYHQQALPTLQEADDRTSEAATLNNIGAVYHALGDRQQALTYYQRALFIRRDVGDRAGEATTLSNIGGIRFQEGDLVGAGAALVDAVQVLRSIGDRGSEALASFNMAYLLLRMERVDDAIQFQRRAVALAEETSHPDLDQMRAFLSDLEQEQKG